ncbi:MAG: thiamine-phosphate kinase [Alphaproteobacteria bacterium]|nr:thiamine-phosphate kinase [Alphaproteobacteria bacterium]MBL7099999.1 thiamine-phosphate kinase [Alphaproteobacteria bacterium]
MPKSEFELIAELFAPLAGKGALGLTDDVALIAPRAGRELVATTDAIVAGVDFFPNEAADVVARRALRVNLSDLAAKGAEPFGYLLTLSLPKPVREGWLRRFASGLAADQKAFGVSLLGGDMSSTPGPLSVSVTAFGWVPKGRAILRRGAGPGDLVFVTGTIGDSGAGLRALKAKKREAALIARYRVPEPRVALGLRLRGIASAALDVSDGLLADLGHIADVSNVHVAVIAERVPLSQALRRFDGDVVRAVTAGDDYEIAFTAPRGKRTQVMAAAKAAGVRVSEIGFVAKGRGVALLGQDGRVMPVVKKGWEHF